jgi:dienelactone hydrolase
MERTTATQRPTDTQRPTGEEYDPFARGGEPIGVRTVHARDAARDRLFPIEIWYPASGGPDPGRDAAVRPGPHPLVIYSHQSGGNRTVATYLCTHLSAHGYVVAALDHSETVAPDLAPARASGASANIAVPGETAGQRLARAHRWIENRVPDVRFLLDHLLGDAAGPDLDLDPDRIAVVGHSFGGWTALESAATDPRVRAVVAMAPGGSSRPRPGVLPLTLTFDRGRAVPTLYLVAEDDVPTPLDGMYELFDRTPGTRRMFILRRADHQHFVDDAEGTHETWRTQEMPGEAAWMSAAMRPFGELCPAADAHLFVRGLTLAHLDATLRESAAAQRFLAGDVVAHLARRGVTALAHARHQE